MNPRHHHPQPPMSDEDRQAASILAPYVEQTKANIDKAVEMIELRKWIVERACQVYPTYCMAEQAVGRTDSADVMLQAVLTRLHTFVRAPLDAVIEDLDAKAKGR